MLAAALDYAKQGFKVFPLKPRGKTPITAHGVKDATQLQATVKEYWRKNPNANIGLSCDGLLVLDFDGKAGAESKTQVITKYGELPRTWVIKTGGGTEAEPKEQGEHYVYRVPTDLNIRPGAGKYGYPNLDIRASDSYIVAAPSITRLPYETIDNSPVSDAPDWLINLATKGRDTNKLSPVEDQGGQQILDGQRNATLTSFAGTMRRRGMSREAIEAALIEVNERQCQPPLSDDEVKAIAQSVSRYSPNDLNSKHVCIYTNGTEKTTHERDKNGTKSGTPSLQKESSEVSRFESLSKKIMSWVEETTGWWETSELDKDLGITVPKDKENRRKILLRLRDRGIIEPHQKLNKQFRYVNTKVTSLAFKTASTAGVLPIQWPLGIEKYVNLFPGNMAVVAGSPNAGKTALMLNFIYLNQDNFPVFYFCSEMGEVELRDRLDKFPGMDVEDWHFEAKERASDFADVVKPDCVNVIDYLEMTTELYAVNTHLTAISHKLGSGIAIVALQKKHGATFGRGQEFGLEKPKLYLSLDKGKLQIVKGKSWAKKNVDPQGLTVNFKIIDGCQFQASGEWDWPH